ncbi:MAG TPA: class I SAM-dependent methyltransferase [Candidatus Lokiarchaeia archaeon]|nr:class I SAM-dependent methyltransferase [Candidatus Lokiarchaeia archaeon]
MRIEKANQHNISILKDRSVILFMNFEEFLSRLKFIFIKPNTPLPLIVIRLIRYIERKAFISFEILNIKIPSEFAYLKWQFYLIRKIPKFSAIALGYLINVAVSNLCDDESFVNVGVWNGFTFISGLLNNASKKCIGIDNFSEFGGPKEAFLARFEKYKNKNHLFYEINYLEYFRNIHKGPIGFYIYDGEHSYANQMEGLKVAEPHFSKNCLVLVDDINFQDPWRATFDFLKQSHNKYKVLLCSKTYSNLHPTLWNGVLIFRRVA